MRGEITFLPPRTSTTDSVGMTICPILSVRPNAATRPSRLSFTFFSNPEYVWTIYHCFGIAVPSVLNIVNQPGERLAHKSVREIKKDPEKCDGDDHHKRGR